jgi:PilZ domain-containing protein
MKAIESRSPVDQCLRFRLQDEDRWRNGRTVNVSRSGLLFSSAQSLEIGSVVEINLNLRQLIGSENVRYGVVVRRVLMAWPDINALVAIRFIEDDRRPGEYARDQVAG